jgi:hypothetical protein
MGIGYVTGSVGMDGPWVWTKGLNHGSELWVWTPGLNNGWGSWVLTRGIVHGYGTMSRPWVWIHAWSGPWEWTMGTHHGYLTMSIGHGYRTVHGLNHWVWTTVHPKLYSCGCTVYGRLHNNILGKHYVVLRCNFHKF